jgi:hypothetical protein
MFGKTNDWMGKELPSNTIKRCFTMVGSVPQEVIAPDAEMFAYRWGGLHARAILQALREANDLDRIAAMFLLGCYHQLGEEAQRWAEGILHPFLESPDLLERGASAIPFAWRNERHVLPVLRTFLTESLFPQHPSPVAKPHVVLALCDDWRIDVVRLLGQWQIPSLLPVFCEVWLALVYLLEQQALLPRSQRGRHQKYLFDCIDHIAFALGQLDAFTVLDDLPLSELEKENALIHMACGHLWVQHPDQWMLDPEVNSSPLKTDHALAAAVVRVLEQQCGMSPSEGKHHLQQWFNTPQQLAILYGNPPNPKLAPLYREDILKLERAMEARRASTPATQPSVQPGKTETVDERNDDFSDLDLHDF